jgi:hypothetical protein
LVRQPIRKFDAALLKYFEALRAPQRALQHATLAQYATALVRKKSELAPLRNSQLAINVFLEFKARRPSPAPTYLNLVAGLHRRRYLPFKRPAAPTLSARAVDRVWTRVAEGLTEESLNSSDYFVEHVQRAFVAAVLREVTQTDSAALEFGEIPSTYQWVHRYSLHTGLSPPTLLNADALGAGVGHREQGGPDGLVQRRKIKRNLLERRHVRRLAGRLLSHSAKARDPHVCAKPDHSPGGREALSHAWRAPRRSGYARLVNQLRLVRGSGGAQHAARTLMEIE